jgi:hypothetical protein
MNLAMEMLEELQKQIEEIGVENIINVSVYMDALSITTELNYLDKRDPRNKIRKITTREREPRKNT